MHLVRVRLSLSLSLFSRETISLPRERPCYQHHDHHEVVVAKSAPGSAFFVGGVVVVLPFVVIEEMNRRGSLTSLSFLRLADGREKRRSRGGRRQQGQARQSKKKSADPSRAPTRTASASQPRLVRILSRFCALATRKKHCALDRLSLFLSSSAFVQSFREKKCCS
jgi:hypothetical protein